MVLMEIFLSDKAFAGIVVAAIEAYHDECIGLLLGYKTPNRIVIEDCIVYQSAKRRPSEVEPIWNREIKIRDIIPKLIHLQPLGYFHSHTQWGSCRAKAELSESDIDTIRPTEVEVIVAVNNGRRSVKWYETRDHGLAGTIGRYHISLAAFYKKKNGEVKQYRISCPYALGFDYAF